MNRLTITAIGTAFLLLAGGRVSAQSPEMYTLGDIYYYLIEGREATEGGYSLEPPPGSVPGDTRFKTLKEIYRDAKALFDECDVLPSDVAEGKRFFSAEAGNWGVRTGTAPAVTGLLKTGQTISYGLGDDGYYQKGAAYDYTDNLDGTITDNFTGLIWPKSGSGAGCYGGDTIRWHEAIDWAEGLTFAGYSDWRLPNVRELFSLIVEDPAYSPGPYINPTYFPATRSDDYWTSTSYPPQPNWAFRLEFDTASVAGLYRERCYARAVRGGN